MYSSTRLVQLIILVALKISLVLKPGGLSSPFSRYFNLIANYTQASITLDALDLLVGMWLYPETI